MATVNLGNIKFNWKGAYNNSTAYVVDDVVSSSGSSYICILASTGNAPTNTTYWQQMSAAGANGTNGTDLTTTLTTQGDLVYRDGSGLAKLGAGTSGQVLQTGGSGANPSWGTVSSDYVKLGETDVGSGSAVARVDFTNIFTSTYDNYKIFASNINCDSGAPAVALRYMNGGAYHSSSHYQTVINSSYASGSTLAESYAKDWSADKSRIIDFGLSSADAMSSSFELTILNPLSSTQETTAHAIFTTNQSSYAYLQGGTSSFSLNSTASYNGISIFPTSNNFDKGIFKIYGIK